jgi:alkanesulfonate monooxygenase SsuD/methylene tetrahydromethanopterin reductase-like flavin-dependent oxidoreductase (luciferase family)
MAMMFMLRFDFRNPAFAGTSFAERYAAGLDMAEWADRLGAISLVLSEHHASPDGYLPSPITMLTAMAARTKRANLMIAALLAPFWDPLRLAEDLCVADHISGGRLGFVLGAGYARQEFAMFGVELAERPQRMREAVAALRGAFSGEPFEFRGRTVHVTPGPFRPGGPPIVMGGGSEPAARRAAQIGDGFMPTTPEAWPFYRDEMQKLGKPDPGPGPSGAAVITALAADVDEGWEKLGPYFLHDANAYGAWQAQDNIASPYRTMDDVAALRAFGSHRVITPGQMIDELRAAPMPLASLHPMCGGVPPALAWEGLRLFEHEVLPAFADGGKQ